MGNCCRCKKQPKRNIVLLLVGLDNAGKTVAVKGLAGENPENSIPTVGFSVVNLYHSDYNVHIYDLGGGSEIRGIWYRYFVDAHGVIFVVDASDFNRFNEVKTVLKELLSHEKISGKPLLLLANKQDEDEALDEIDIVEKLDLEDLVNEKRCPTLVETCSAKDNDRGSNKTDPGIETGYKWLLNYILKEFHTLNDRVELDVRTQKIIDDKKRQEKIDKFKLKQDNGIEIENTEIEKFDPFRPISELVNGVKTNVMKSPNNSVKSTNSVTHLNSVERPKSALQIVKKQLQNQNHHRRNSFLSFTTNKTAPITLLSPKSAPIPNGVIEHKNDTFQSESSQILTVTELPNAIIDANGENIGDLFELNNFSSSKRLPPLRQKNVDEYQISWINKPIRNDVIQTNVDEIYKDIS